MSRTLKITLEDEIFLGLNRNPEQLAKEIRLAAAVKWYELGRISQDKAAQIAGLSREKFIFSLADFGVSVFQETEEDIINAIREQ